MGHQILYPLADPKVGDTVNLVESPDDTYGRLGDKVDVLAATAGSLITIAFFVFLAIYIIIYDRRHKEVTTK
jgi:hypothetical protein